MSLDPLFRGAMRRQQSGLYVPAAISWEGPLTVTQTSGTHTYTGRNFDYTGTSTTTGAVTNTGNGTAIYRFVDCRFRSKSHIFWSSVGTCGVEFENCVMQCLDPVVDGQQWGYVISGGKINRIVVENCTLYNTGGIRGLSPTNLDYVRMRYNAVNNLVGWFSNGTGAAGIAGSRTVTSTSEQGTTYVAVSFLQLAAITAAAGGAGSGTGGTSRSECGWNYIVNTPYESLAGDVFSFIGAAGGVSGNNIWLHNNFVNGLYFYDPIAIENDGRVVQMENSGGGYIDVEDFIMTRCHGGIEINAGKDNVNISRNKYYFSKKIDGVTCTYGPAPYPYVGKGTGTNQVFTNNELQSYGSGYVGGNSPTNRPFIENSANSGNSLGTGWVSTGSCTEAIEDAQAATWLAAAASAGHTIGSSLTID